MPELLDVVVPVLWRPNNARPFMHSLRRTALPHEVQVTAVVGEADGATRRAWSQHLHRSDQLLVDPKCPNSFACKVNLAYRATQAPWLLLVGDDVVFEPGWLEHLIGWMGSDGLHVIGTQDKGHNRGELQSPHPVVRRTYVEEQGASWDGPGIVCHEGYHHNCVDREIARVARDRDVWAFADDVVIRHRHPHFGTAAADRTYRLGASNQKADTRLYRERAQHYTRT